MTSGHIRAAGAALLLAAAPLAGLPPAAAQQQTVGLFVNDVGACEGYTLLARMYGKRSLLINNDGLLVHSWNGCYDQVMSYLLEDGHLLRHVQLPAVDQRFHNAFGYGGRIEELDWDGTRVWEFELSSSQRLAHHDIEKLPNGNVLISVWEYHTRNEALAAGRNPATIMNALWSDAILEVRPTPPSGGTIVWEWRVWDHLIQDHDPTKANFGAVGDHLELLDLNFPQGIMIEDWNHVNSVKYNPSLDQIVLSSRIFSEFWVIDHSTTSQEAAGHAGGRSGKGGDILYRWGNPQVYRRGTAADQKLFSQHDAQWVPPDRPGAGDFLVFNNGNGRGDYSSVDEIVAPPMDRNRNYPILPGSPYDPTAPAWSYTSDPPEAFYSHMIGGVERQPNGNTLICEGNHGVIFEVTSDGTEVWRYVSPVGSNGPVHQGVAASWNNVFKARRYAPDYPGLVGKALTPGDPVELFERPYPVPGGSLLASKVTPAGDQIDVSWNATSCPSGDYNLLFGDLAEVSTYRLLGAECGIGVSGAHRWPQVPSGSLYFVVVGRDAMGVYESSWGHSRSGQERNGTKASFLCGATTKVVTSACP